MRFVQLSIILSLMAATTCSNVPKKAASLDMVNGPIEVTLFAIDDNVIDKTTIVSFGAPFPRGMLTDIRTLLVTDASGNELPSHVEVLLPWRTTGAKRDGDGSIRSALIQVEVKMSAATTHIQLHRNAQRSLELESPPDPMANWSGILLDDYAEEIAEPPVYAVFPADWLSSCAIRGFTTPVGTNKMWKFYDKFSVGAAATAVNAIDPTKEQIDLSGHEPWLYDRAMTLFSIYIRTGDINWLRHAHRAAGFYAKHITSGYFDLKGSEQDLKYSYGQSLLIDMMFTGDRRLVTKIEEVAAAGESWNPAYSLKMRFWTERHQAYALLAALSAFEATGKPEHEDRLTDIIDASFNHASNPPDSSWANDGCLLHTAQSHEGLDNLLPVCSPWMSALLAEAIWRYYLQSEDKRALILIGSFAKYTVRNGLRLGEEGLNRLVPWYMSSSAFEYTSDGPYGDIEHSCDVLGMVIRGIYALSLLGEPYANLTNARDELMQACEYNLNSWHRPGSSSGAEWRLSPPRKFNWWFGSTHDMGWLTDNTK